MKKIYIAPASSHILLDPENALLTGSGDPKVGIDETGTSVDGALTHKKGPWDSSLWSSMDEE